MGNATTIMGEHTTHRTLPMNIGFSISVAAVALVGICGNLATMIAVVTTEELKLYLPNLFTFALALTDFLTSVFVMLPVATALAVDRWPFGQEGCDFHQFINYFCIVYTTQLLALISLDRALSITWPFHYPLHVTRNRILIAIFSSAGAALTTASIPISMRVDTFDYWEATCGVYWAAGTILSYLYAYINYVVFISFPQVVIIWSTVIIVRAVKKSQQNIKTVKQEGRSSEDKQESKLLKSLIVLIIAYEMTIGVWAGLRIIKATDPTFDVNPPWINTLTTPLLYLGSAVNPFIYAILRKDFRNAFKRIFSSMRNKINPL